MIRLLDIQRMSSEDGPGLRSTAFLKGCTLACAWCHNPESISSAGEVLWHSNRCMACVSCVEVCPRQGITAGVGRLSIEREHCLACFACVRACPTGAMEAKGREVTVQELARELLKDRAYFGIDGGVTLSGGEALMQAESIELLQALHEAGVSVAVDTCGQIGAERLMAALPFVDIVLYDLKLADSAEHKRWTGMGNELIWKNLARVLSYRRELQASHPAPRLWLRTPIIPGASDSDANIVGLARRVSELVAEPVAKLVPEPVLEPVLEFMPEPSSDSRAEDVSAASKVIERWELAAFNNLCASKYESMERGWAFSGASLVSSQRMERLVALAKAELPGVDIRATGATATGATATSDTATGATVTGATPLTASPSTPAEG